MSREGRLPPVRVQVVFQGGGARVFGHLAACEVLEEFAQIGHPTQIEITSVAGSSAGALAAAALAMPNTSVAEIKGRFLAEARRIEGQFATGLRGWVKLPFRLCRVLFGGGFFGGVELRSIFRRIYRSSEPDGPYIVVEQLQPPAFLYFSDTALGRMVAAPGSDEVAYALAKSCNFPFAFSGWRRESEFVDGGLGQNLPVDELYARQATEGEVLAFAFEEEIGPRSRVPVIGHLQRLFSTAINVSVTRSRRLLGAENVISISTTVGTFDFSAAIKACDGRDYNSIKKDIRTKLKAWVERRQTLPGSWVKPSNANSRLPNAFTNHLQREAEAGPLLHARKVVSADVALLERDRTPNETYRTILRSEAKILRPTQLVRWRQWLPGDRTAGEVQLRGSAQGINGTSLRLDLHVNRDFSAQKNRTIFDFYFCFERQLVENEEITFQYELEVPNPYPQAATGIEYSTLRAVHGPIDEAFVLVLFPKELMPAQPRVIDVHSAAGELRSDADVPSERTYVPTSEVPAGPLLPYAGVLAGDSFFIVARRAANIRYREALGFIVDSRGC